MRADVLSVALSFRPTHRIQVILCQVGAAHQRRGWGTAKRKEQFLPRVVLAQKKKTKTALNLEQDRIGM